MNEQPIKSHNKPLIFPIILTVGCAVLFLYIVIQDAQYSLYGLTTVAKVTHKKQESRSTGGRGSSTYQVLVIDYSFQEAGGAQRVEQDELDLQSPLIEADETVQVEYIPGIANSSRIKGAQSSFKLLLVPGVGLFIGCAFLVSAMVRKR
jgi:hypothetical protein